MQTVTYENSYEIADSVGGCFLANPIFISSISAAPVLVLWLSYYVLWRRGFPSAGATAYLAVHGTCSLLLDANTLQPPTWLMTWEVVILTVLLNLRLDGAAVVSPRVRATLLWTLYGGLYTLLLFSENSPSVWCIVALVTSALLLQHPIVLSLWLVVLILYTEESLRQDMDFSQGWSVLLSWVGVLGAAQVVYVYVLGGASSPSSGVPGDETTVEETHVATILAPESDMDTERASQSVEDEREVELTDLLRRSGGGDTPQNHGDSPA
jgi:hypothetical protein